MKTMIERNAQRTRRKAMVFAVVFHVLLIGGLTYSSNSDTPIFEQIQAFFGTDTADEDLVVMKP